MRTIYGDLIIGEDTDGPAQEGRLMPVSYRPFGARVLRAWSNCLVKNHDSPSCKVAGFVTVLGMN